MAAETDLGDDIVDLWRELISARVEFLVVGAHALAAHGIPRATGDIDIFVEPSSANAERLYRALVAFGAPLAMHGVSAQDFARPRYVYQIGLPPHRIDLLTAIDGVSYAEARSSRLWAEMEGFAIPFLGREMLLKNKRAAARPKDLLDIALLEERRGR